MAEKTNSMGMPTAEFIEDVDKYMEKDPSKAAPQVIKQFDDLRTKYKIMQASIIEKKRRLKVQIPDIKNSLDAIKVLEIAKQNKKDIETKYLLNSSVYVPALIPVEKADTVILVLGANVMVEYSLDEAKKLLNKNLELGTKNLAQLEVDNDFVNDQIVTTEVNMARIHNWAIERKEKLKK